jgi:hypothetical protein
MTKRKKQAIILLALSVPMMWWGFTNFMSGTTNSTALAMGIALSCTLGSLFAISGLTMLITKNSLGIWNPDDKGKKDRGVVLASQANVGDSLVENLSTADKIRQRNEAAIDNLVTKTTDNAIKTLTKKQKVKPMVKTKDTSVADSVKEIRELEENLVQSEEIIKKETLNVKTTTEKIAVLKHNLAKDKAVKELLAIVTDYQLKQ